MKKERDIFKGPNGVQLTRRTLLGGVAGVGLSNKISSTSSAVRSQSGAEGSEAWPQYQYDAGNTGHAPTNTGPDRKPVEQWHFPELGKVTEVVSHGNEIYVGDGLGNVLALNGADGTKIWEFNAQKQAETFLTIDQNRIYVATSTGAIYGLNPGNGAEQWHIDVERVDQPPEVDQNRLFVGGAEGTLYAFDARSGTELWSTQKGNWVSSPTVNGDALYVGSVDNNVYKISVVDGSEEWSFETGGFVETSPTVRNGSVFVGSHDGVVYRLDAANGTEDWSFDLGSVIDVEPVAGDNIVYVTARNESLYAISTESGTIEWEYDRYVDSFLLGEKVYIGGLGLTTLTPGEGEELWSKSDVDSIELAEADSTLYTASRGAVSARDSSTGDEIWSVDIGVGDMDLSAPVIGDKHAYVGDQEGDLHAVRISDGGLLWTFESGDSIDSTPVIFDNVVYFCSGRTLYALSAKEGSEIWSYETERSILSSPIISDGHIYFNTYQGSTYSVTAGTGNERWVHEADSLESTGLAVAQDTVFTGTSSGDLYALDSETGTERWKRNVDNTSVYNLTVDERNIYLTTHAEIFAFGRESGTERWNVQRDEPVTTSLTVVDDTILLGGLTTLYGLDPQTGNEIWSREIGNSSIETPTADRDTIYVHNGERVVAYDLQSMDEKWSILEIFGSSPPTILGERLFSAGENGLHAVGNGVSSNMDIPRLLTMEDERVFSASGTGTTADSIERYEWAFGADTDFSKTGEQVRHTFSEAGVYTVKLRVTDSAGHTDMTTRTIQVFEEAPESSFGRQTGENESDTPEKDDGEDSFSVFRRFTNEPPAMWMAGVGLVSVAGFGLYHWMKSDD